MQSILGFQLKSLIRFNLVVKKVWIYLSTFPACFITLLLAYVALASIMCVWSVLSDRGKLFTMYPFACTNAPEGCALWRSSSLAQIKTAAVWWKIKEMETVRPWRCWVKASRAWVDILNQGCVQLATSDLTSTAHMQIVQRRSVTDRYKSSFHAAK